MRSVARAFIGLLVISMPISTMAQPRPRTVLVLVATTTNTPYFQEVNKAFNAGMEAESANSVYSHVESLGVREFEGPRHAELLRNFLRERYRDKPIG